MEYNTLRPQLKITDYGRIVAKLIDHAKTLPTKEERNAAAEIIVHTMAQVNPQVKHTANYRRELWEHLMILSDWELDVDCPYPLQPQERVSFQPRQLNSSGNKIDFRHYGHCLEEMVRKVAEMPDSEEKELLSALLVAQMKKSYLVWNRSAQHAKVEDYTDVVLTQLDTLSEGRLQEGELKLEVNTTLMRPAESINTSKKKRNKKKKK